MKYKKLSTILLSFYLFSVLLVDDSWSWPLKNTLIKDDPLPTNQKWTTIKKNPQENIRLLLLGLQQSSTGLDIYKQAKVKAAQLGTQLEEMISAGENSMTRLKIIRKISIPPSLAPSLKVTKKATRIIDTATSSTITINQDLPFYEAILDLSHELTHFIFKNDFNPYNKNFNLKYFIYSTIEGTGGEVDAYIVECKVWQQLFNGKYPSKSICRYMIYDPNYPISRTEISANFYKLGDLYSSFLKEIKKFNLKQEDFPLVSKFSPIFISSAYDLPYPLAAVEEFIQIKKVSCENQYKRIKLIKLKISNPDLNQKDVIKQMEINYIDHCEGFFIRI